MRHDFGTVTIAAAGTAVQFSTSSLRLRAIFIRARAGNSAPVYLGITSAVSSGGNGYEIAAAGTLELNQDHFGGNKDGSMEINSYWVNAGTSGLKVDWFGVFEH